MKIKKFTIIMIQILLILNALTVITISEGDEPIPVWPASVSSWILMDEDPTENGPGDDYRDVKQSPICSVRSSRCTKKPYSILQDYRRG